MLRNVVINSRTYFYPLGNTPAVCLSQDLPPEGDADILLLGCGDARNILFTCFADPNKRLDFTCCDIEASVVARNILLYTLILDDTNNSNLDQIWDIYFHWKIDEQANNLLQNQLEKLLKFSSSRNQWLQSKYGSMIRFSNSNTIRDVSKFWQGCASRSLNKNEYNEWQSLLQANIAKARKIRDEIVGNSTLLACVRSASPVGIQSIADFNRVCSRWWSNGTTKANDSQAQKLNPMFLWSSNENLVLHYATDPLLGFPLANAYLSILSDELFRASGPNVKAEEKLVDCARQHFKSWMDAFKSSIKNGTRVRFCVADALSFALVLQNLDPTSENGLISNIRTNSWTSEPLVLDKDEYGGNKLAPSRFDVIDTSNLIDHLGPLNLLPASALLMKPLLSSTVYTEALLQHDKTEMERMSMMFGGEIRTVALLLGLSACEVWTNATSSAEDDSIFNMLDEVIGASKLGGARQVRCRLRWKLLYSDDHAKAVVMEPIAVSKILASLYDHMFRNEDIKYLLSNLNASTMSKLALPCYSRASFAMLLRCIQSKTQTDWKECLSSLNDHIISTFSSAPTGANSYQELLLHMHMLQLETETLPTINLKTEKPILLGPRFASWPSIPVQTCVTLRVPRKALEIFTSTIQIGTPTLKLEIEDIQAKPRPWSNSFTAIQLAFGNVRNASDTEVHIIEDGSTWWGQSDLLVSAYVPSWILLQPSNTIPIVRCSFLSTTQTVGVLSRTLGPKLSLFETEISSENVFLSEFMPGTQGLPSLLRAYKPAVHSDQILSAIMDATGLLISAFVYKIDFASRSDKSILQDRSTSVKVDFQDLFQASITLGNRSAFKVSFPVPVDHMRHKLRIARKSCYVEVEVPLWNPLGERSSMFLFPTLPSKQQAPVLFTATKLNLDRFPRLDLTNKKNIEWLITHTSMMMSSQERRIREAGLAGNLPQGQKPNTRIEIKEGIFSMFMSYTGLQGHKANVFGLTKDVGGVNVIFMPSSMRLDFTSRTIVLDMALLPLTMAMMKNPKVQIFLQNLTNHKLLQIKVSDEEMVDWKRALPAMVERCRTWSHTENCAYKTQQVPILKGLEDGFSPICSCGVGQFPSGYLEDLKINNLDYVLRHYSTRMALSPIFALPYVEDCCLSTKTLAEIHDAQSKRCAKCGANKRKESETANLLVCARCKKVKYCSQDCQKADWKDHKPLCSAFRSNQPNTSLT